MPFIIHPQAFHPQPSFNPFFDLLREAGRDSCQPKQRPARTFTPKFDITESETAYELYGDLAGVQPKDVTIEFTDRQTLTVRGHRDRQTSSTAAAATPSTPSAPQKAPESHKATVEDDFEEVNASDSDAATTTSTAQNTETTATEEKAAERKSEEPKTKFWIAERGVGEFSRYFEFQEGIDREGVKASFNNGVLTIVVPKEPFHSKKVEIN